ncbi:MULTISPECIES: GntR family transcriptional regulator [Sporosarcina]|uniref:GntR family transcriptional regulator n=1 Tax=Sporosarcina psychrophila TaxID=1476 RepID=A0ABV2KC84_SPOPS|nr:GntR family transcriptional regulator [Sporosarcina psychrophila]AMQ05845.1 GntR family transcriptional regulator [Sporosarcina psychrophila]
MFIQIEPESDIPIYAQLASQLIEAIARGILVGGDALPSVRSLAADLGMNMHTVNKAYHELERKEIIRIVPKSGAIVNPLSQDDIRGDHLERISTEIKPIIAEAIVLGMKPEAINKLISSIILSIKEE